MADSAGRVFLAVVLLCSFSPATAADRSRRPAPIVVPFPSIDPKDLFVPGVGSFDKCLICKLTMGELKEEAGGVKTGAISEARCRVVTVLQGEIPDEFDVFFVRVRNGPRRPNIAAIRGGQTILTILEKREAGYEILVAMPVTAEVVEPAWGTAPVDRLFAELMAMCRSDSAPLRALAVEQIGLLRDKRGAEEISKAAASSDADFARAGLIAQYRLRIAPDVARVVELFDHEMLEVWADVSGHFHRDETGKRVKIPIGRRTVEQRGLPDFDYATLIREGIRKDWVREDDGTLSQFFHIPWIIQRRDCVPALVELLDHPDVRVRKWAVKCLAHTVDGERDISWDDDTQGESRELGMWRAWWRQHEEQFQPAVKKAQPM